MPTPSYFSKYPQFPSDIAVAKLPVLSLSKLLSKDDAESDALFEASRTLGFFLIDLSNDSFGEEFLRNAESMFDLNEEVHGLSTEELMKYAYKPPTSLFGYKHLGNLKIESGLPDRLEFYNVGRDDITGVSAPLSNPRCIEDSRPRLKEYMKQAHAIIELICSHLEKQLRLEKGTLMKLQSFTEKSGTALRMLKYEPQPANDRRTSLLGHTDIGSLTLLFNITGGLQILTPDADPSVESSWTYIKPQPSTCIVNLGDAMVEWSAGILRSNMHRVTYAPGEQAEVTRYSLAYLVRPSGDAPMKRLAPPTYPSSLVPPLAEDEEAENEMNAREWEAHKAVAIRSGKDNARSRGGRPFNGESKKNVPAVFIVGKA
ncbi:2OG-Fe(II) oxygenase family protein [Rutstroemia sp. NJR-2017a WRK4]|nr:2OG-Fe(II) oxygenase family protein [Rutstroemia sp. NJR-2017a WRK4]